MEQITLYHDDMDGAPFIEWNGKRVYLDEGRDRLYAWSKTILYYASGNT